MGTAYVTTDMEKRDAFAEDDLPGEGEESVLHVTNTTQCLTGNKVLEEEEPEKSLVHAINKTLDLPTYSPVTLLIKLSQFYVIHKDQSLERLNS